MKLLLAMVALAACVATGCTEPTDSPMTPHSYHSDLENTVVLAVHRGNIDDDLLLQIGLVADRHGLANWALVDETFAAIGAGLREADADKDTAESVADLVSDGDAKNRQAVLQAYGGQ